MSVYCILGYVFFFCDFVILLEVIFVIVLRDLLIIDIRFVLVSRLLLLNEV